MFWSVDIAMNSLGAVTRVSFLEHAKKVIKLIKDYFLNWFNQLVLLLIYLDAVRYPYIGDYCRMAELTHDRICWSRINRFFYKLFAEGRVDLCL